MSANNMNNNNNDDASDDTKMFPSGSGAMWAVHMPNDAKCACFECARDRNELDQEAFEAVMDATAIAAFQDMEQKSTPSAVAPFQAVEREKNNQSRQW
jgi:hypothetical protein